MGTIGRALDVERLKEQLERAYSGDAWHGPSVREALADVAAPTASARPIAGAHTIWEIVLHLTSWKYEVCRRLEGMPPQTPVEGDWPAMTGTDEMHWSAAREGLMTAHRRLIAATRLVAEERLADMVGAHRDQPLGSGVTFLEMLLGSIQHDVYHAGQIVMLRKAIEGGGT